MDDDQFHQLQLALIERPDAGDVIRNSGGIRKVRWTMKGKGKRGGLRVIYYWITEDHQIVFLTAYAKSQATDISPAALKEMRRIVENL